MAEYRKIGTRYSKFEDKTIRDMLEDGKSTLEIAKVLDRPVGGIEKRISEFKLHKNANRAAGNVRPEEITRIIDLYLQGKRMMDIVDETKRSDRTIKRITLTVDYTRDKAKMTCKFCGEAYTGSNIARLRGMGKRFLTDGQMFVCPDCWDNFKRLPLKDTFKILSDWLDKELGVMIMREILFRGKCTDNGEWVEGAYSPYNWNAFYERENDPQIIIFSNNEIIDGKWVSVIPETVGQFTGLTDRNGVKIFEGDIVKAFKHNEELFIFAITYRVGSFWFGNWNWIEFLDTFRNVEVIGNIHDNPELLKGGD